MSAGERVADTARKGGSVRSGKKYRIHWLLLILLAVGLVLRLRGIVSFPLEGDEMYTFLEARDLFATSLQPGIEARPLYYLFQHALASLIPDSLAPDRHPALLRILPVTFGVAGIWASWKLATEAAGRMAGIAGGVLAVFSPWHLYASGMARYWSLVFLLACLTYWRLLLAYRTDRLQDHLAAALLTVLGAVTHPTFLFPVAGSLVALRLRDSGNGISWRWPSDSEWKGFWLPVGGLLGIGLLALAFTGNEEAVRNWGGRDLAAVFRLLPAMVQWATPVVVAAGLLGMAVSLGQAQPADSSRVWGRMAVGGTASAIVLLIAASFATNVYADYGIAALPLVLVSAGVLVAWIGGRFEEGSLVAFASLLLVILAALAPPSTSHLLNGTRFDYRPAFDAVGRVAPELQVYVSPIIQQRWYAPDLKGHELIARPNWIEDELSDGSAAAWLVVPVRRYGIVGDEGHRFRRWLSAHCDLHLVDAPLRFDYREYRIELHLCS